tara:strand:+ start:355 stop:723 length:369 start_codon:yes stop_codon:yes gene_type:complete
MMGLLVIFSYIIAVIFAKKPLDKKKFKKYFKLFIISIFILMVCVFLTPGEDNYIYRELLISVIISVGGCVLHISARRYMEIGGNRWNCFVPYIHFSEFIRLWWECPGPKRSKVKDKTDETRV